MSCDQESFIKLLVGCVILLVEYYLGKTEKVKSGSLIELCLNILLKIKGIIYKEK